MRTGRAVLLIAVAVVFAVAAGRASGLSGLPGAGYPWAQPGAAVVNAPSVQPPARIPITPAVVSPPVSSYAWGQPGTAAVSVSSAQPPARIPITPAVPKRPVPASGYVWAQPGTATVTVPSTQPPAWIHAG
jgi:hypothetical protein